jgi:multidrug efflux pump subunit AcrA (membrane-fusion protein)
MENPDLARLEADLAAAHADVARLRAENAKLAEGFRAEPTDAGREMLKRAAASLAAARDREDAAKAALEIYRKTGSLYGLVAGEGRVTGKIGVLVPPGATKTQREKAIEEALNAELHRAAEELGVVLAAAPANYTKERPGRDADGKTVLEVAGRVEGDRLVPAVSRAAKNLRN